MMQYLIGLFILLAASCGAEKASEAGQKPTVVHEDAAGQEAHRTGENPELWRTYSKDDLPDLEKRIEPAEYSVWKCNYEQLLQSFGGQDTSIVYVALPTEGGVQTFHLMTSGAMNSELAKKFPGIRSYKGRSQNGDIQARVDINDLGVFAEFRSGEGKSLLAPLLAGSREYYALFRESALPGSPRDDTYR